MKHSPVYTRTGDHGTTSLVGGTRVPKTHIRIEAYGTVDELNSAIGLLATYTTGQDATFLEGVQKRLFVVGSYLATEDSRAELRQAWTISPEQVADMEAEIDRIDATLPRLHSFVLPGGTRPAAVAQLCRTICRRAERCILSLAQDTEIDAGLTAYVNRLSDYLFVLARKLCREEKNNENLWDGSCK